MVALAESPSLSAKQKVDIVVAVVGKSVTEVSALRAVASKSSVIGSIMGKTMESLDSLGIASTQQATESTLKAVSASATSALASTGFSSDQFASVVSQSVVGAMVKGMDNLKVGSATSLGNLVSSVMAGASSGVTSLTQGGKVTDNEAVAMISSALKSSTDAVSALKVASAYSPSEISSVTDQVASGAPPTITYAMSVLNLTQGSVAEPLIPTVSGKFTDCSVTPSLPTGLDLSKNCVISGTPNVVSRAAVYHIKPSNSGLPTTLTITVSPAQSVIASYNYYQLGVIQSSFVTGMQSSGGFQGWILGQSPAKVSAVSSNLTSGYVSRRNLGSK